MRAKLWNPTFKYASAEASRKPGYLAERFATVYKPKSSHDVLQLKRAAK